MCATGGKGNCKAQCVTYKIQCQNYKDLYIGETSKNAAQRGEEHRKQLASKASTSVLWRHCKEKHQGEVQAFQMSVTGYFRDAMTRQISEAVQISKIRESAGINSKEEWHHRQLPTLHVN